MTRAEVVARAHQLVGRDVDVSWRVRGGHARRGRLTLTVVAGETLYLRGRSIVVHVDALWVDRLELAAGRDVIPAE